tara:strand:- start:6326 stop:6454 length:129 start_codon:yes stop_codon:yes gene_type:complete
MNKYFLINSGPIGSREEPIKVIEELLDSNVDISRGNQHKRGD